MEADTSPHDLSTQSTALPTLLAFLDEHAAACPECGYSLRGIGSPNCPECGRAVTLRPGNGVDLRSVLRLATWLAYIGVLVSASRLIGLLLNWLAFRGGLGLPTVMLLSQFGSLILLVLSVSALVRYRRLRHSPARTALRVTRRFSLAILVMFILMAVVPVGLGLISLLFF